MLHTRSRRFVCLSIAFALLSSVAFTQPAAAQEPRKIVKVLLTAKLSPPPAQMQAQAAANNLAQGSASYLQVGNQRGFTVGGLGLLGTKNVTITYARPGGPASTSVQPLITGTVIGRARVIAGVFLLNVSTLRGQQVPILMRGDEILVEDSDTKKLLLRGVLAPPGPGM